MASKTYEWHRIAENLEALSFSAQGLATLYIGERKICIGKIGKELKGCISVCPHAGANLGEGYVDVMGNIVCPLHGYKFSLATGYNRSGEGYFLKVYPIEQREEGIFIGFEEK
jgi:nitrite reductase/ring-hydroxylating ferredoxin subunit